jgi:hypothetical protein
VACVVPPGKPVFGFVSHREKKTQKLRESDCEGVRQQGGHERKWSGSNNQSGKQNSRNIRETVSCAVSAAPMPPGDMFVGKRQTN